MKKIWQYFSGHRYREYFSAAVLVLISLLLLWIAVPSVRSLKTEGERYYVSYLLNQFDLGKKDISIFQMELVHRFFPNDQNVTERLSLMYFETGEYGKFSKILSSSKDDSSKILSLRALDEKLQGKSGGAVEYYEEAIKLSPKSDYLYINLAAVYQESGQLDKATEVLERGIEVQASSSKLYLAAASLAYKEGKNDEAKELAQKSVELGDATGQAEKMLALIDGK